MKSCQVLRDEIDVLHQQVEWQATRIEYLHQRLFALEAQPMPWRVVPIYGLSAPTPTPTPIITYGPIKWGGTD